MTLPTGLPPGLEPPTTLFAGLPRRWQNTETKIVLIGVDGSYWNLTGNYAGKEGVTLAQHVTGLMHLPFNTLVSEGPYQIGATYERTDVKKRTINIGVQVNVHTTGTDTLWSYRRIEERWWRAWSFKEDSWLGCYTRSHGWRWLRVRLSEDPKTPFVLDPVAFDDGFMQWDMVVVALQPYWLKATKASKWVNSASTSMNWYTVEQLVAAAENTFSEILTGQGGTLVPGHDIGSGVLKAWNHGDVAEWPKFLVSSPGRAWIQDGNGGAMIPLPVTTDQDGTVLVDTDPMARTLTCSTDPVDPLLYRILRNSELLQVLLGDVVNSTQPINKRFYGRFTTPIPPRSLANIKVFHSDPTGTVAMLVGQRFEKAYG
jgi:hypothetical protein